MMKSKIDKRIGRGLLLLAVFIIWTILIKTVDVQPLGQKGTDIGFASLNVWFHRLTGENMILYTLTDLLELAAIAICLIFAGIGLYQWIKRKNLVKVDPDILILGAYFILVITCYLAFEKIPVNYRPVLIDGNLESSYPSSTTLLVLSVMMATIEQIGRRVKNNKTKKILTVLCIVFAVFMLFARLISGVHWLTDIIGAILLSSGLFLVYKGAVNCCQQDH